MIWDLSDPARRWCSQLESRGRRDTGLDRYTIDLWATQSEYLEEIRLHCVLPYQLWYSGTLSTQSWKFHD